MKNSIKMFPLRLCFVVTVSVLSATPVSAQESDAQPSAEALPAEAPPAETQSSAGVAPAQDARSDDAAPPPQDANRDDVAPPKAEGDAPEPTVAAAESTPPADVPNETPVERLGHTLTQQQALLEDQKKQLDKQAKLISQQSDSLAKQNKDLDDFRSLLQNMQTQIDQFTQAREKQLSAQDIALRERLQKVEQVVAEIPEDPTKDMKDFPNSLHIPGTTTKLRIGGFVKMAVVDTLKPIGSDDRFIVSSIPVEDDPTINEQVVMTVRQSRLNFEMREETSYGILRAFIEGDFDGGSGSDDTFRLRHAYGQFRDILAGKTWSSFMDLASAPEELDFEGLNGRINVRQAQLRFSPEIGKDLNFIISFEDPSPEVTGGTGVSRFPDVVTSINRIWFGRWNTKVSAIFRQIRAKSSTVSSGTQTELGWGLSFSGRTAIPWLDERDSFMYQINYGDGLGRYIEDLGSLGGADGVFDARGDLSTLKTFAGYVSTQHWWNSQWRSNFVYGWVYVDTLGFQPDDTYESSQRTSANLIFSPVAKIDIGAEVIWGRRENKDGKSASATQVQASVKYRY